MAHVIYFLSLSDQITSPRLKYERNENTLFILG